MKRRNKPNTLLKWGNAWRSAVDVLRTAEKPLTVREVAVRVLTAKGATVGAKSTTRHDQCVGTGSFTNNRGKVVERVEEGHASAMGAVIRMIAGNSPMGVGAPPGT